MLNRLKKINWEKGSSSIVYYVATIWLIVLGAVFFVEGFHVFSKVGKTQIYADILSDGSCFIGDNGWGLNQKNATKAFETLVDKNEEYFEDIAVYEDEVDSSGRKGLDFIYTNEKNKAVKSKRYMDKGKSAMNTVHVTANLESQMLTVDEEITAEKSAETKITYSGGLRIVREAWKHTYQYNPKTQTPYIWGGGHQDLSLGWLNSGADCSGFVTAVYRKCNYKIGNGCTWDLEDCGRTVGDGWSASSLEQARPGDIILYWSSSKGTADYLSTHVGIYAGKYNGVHYQIHCSGGQANDSWATRGHGPSSGAILAPVSMGRPRMKIKRIVDSDAKPEKLESISVGNLSKDQTIIYQYLRQAGYNNNAIKGLMGNWMVESGCCPYTKQGVFTLFGGENARYAKRIQNGQISKAQFVTYYVAGGGYGLCQWTTMNYQNPFADRKAKLWDFAKSRNSDVTRLETQVAFAVRELRSYGLTPGYLNQFDVRGATERVFAEFEMGAPRGTDAYSLEHSESLPARISNAYRLYM